MTKVNSSEATDPTLPRMRNSTAPLIRLRTREHIVTHDHDAQVYFIEFVQLVDELRGLGSAAQQLKKGALEENSRVQSSSQPLLQCYHHLHRVHEVRPLLRLSASLRPSLCHTCSARRAARSTRSHPSWRTTRTSVSASRGALHCEQEG